MKFTEKNSYIHLRKLAWYGRSKLNRSSQLHGGWLHHAVYCSCPYNHGLEDLDVSLCVEWLQVNVAIRCLTENNHEHCAVTLGLAV